MSIKGKIFRTIKEAPLLNKLYRQYTEYKIARGYKNRKGKEVFGEIFEQNKWGGEESRSGSGSDFKQTEALIRGLPILLNKLDIKVLLDVPCGDHLWMSHVDLGEIKYIGGDLVRSLVDNNNRLYVSDNKSFQQIDLTVSELPDAGLILVRDALVHLSLEKIQAALTNIRKSNISYLLTTTFPKSRRNYDITTGNWRPLNLLLPPFNFPAPLELLVENCTEAYGQYADKSLGLWRVDDLPSSIFN